MPRQGIGPRQDILGLATGNREDSRQQSVAVWSGGEHDHRRFILNSDFRALARSSFDTACS